MGNCQQTHCIGKEIFEKRKRKDHKIDNEMSGREYSLPITFKTIATATVSLPSFGFVFCVLWSFFLDYESSTKTHCEVENFAPSISAAIGSFLPQKYVWQVAIALHILPRFLFLWMYKQFYNSRIS